MPLSKQLKIRFVSHIVVVFESMFIRLKSFCLHVSFNAYYNFELWTMVWRLKFCKCFSVHVCRSFPSSSLNFIVFLWNCYFWFTKQTYSNYLPPECFSFWFSIFVNVRKLSVHCFCRANKHIYLVDSLKGWNCELEKRV